MKIRIDKKKYQKNKKLEKIPRKNKDVPFPKYTVLGNKGASF